MLELCYAPRRPRENLLMAGPDQQQIRQHCYAKGFLDASFLCAHLVCTQSQVSLEFPIDLLHGPSALVGTDHLSRNPFVQIGHQDFGLFRADVTPSFTQHHSDVTDVPQAQACAIHPEGFAARGAWQARHPEALTLWRWQPRRQTWHQESGGAERAEQETAAVVFWPALCLADGGLGQLSLPCGLSAHSARVPPRIPQ